jgi:ribosomal protein S12 methylthiotransferase
MILEYADKKKRFSRQGFVTGCLSERYRPDLEKPVDQYFGTTELPALLKARELIINMNYGRTVNNYPKNYAYLKTRRLRQTCSFVLFHARKTRIANY